MSAGIPQDLTGSAIATPHIHAAAGHPPASIPRTILHISPHACRYFPLPPPAKWGILFLSQVRVQNLRGASTMLHPRCRHRSENKNRIRQFGTILSLNKTTGQTAGLQTSPCCDLGWCFFKHRFFYDLPKSLIWHAVQTQRFPKSLIWLKPTV